jgi:hypothetical protein
MISSLSFIPFSILNCFVLIQKNIMQKSNIEKILSVYNFHKKREEENGDRKKEKPQDFFSREQY